jgi:proteic killer suppression protein
MYYTKGKNVIKSFKNAKTRRVYETGLPKGFKGLDANKAVIVLDILGASNSLSELPKLARFRLHKLRDDRAGQWSLTINLPWVVCFIPDKNGGWLNVEIVDYH